MLSKTVVLLRPPNFHRHRGGWLPSNPKCSRRSFWALFPENCPSLLCRPARVITSDHLIPRECTATPLSSPTVTHPLLHSSQTACRDSRDTPGAVLNQTVATVWFSTGLLAPIIQNAIFTTRHVHITHVSVLHPNQTTLVCLEVEEGIDWGWIVNCMEGN